MAIEIELKAWIDDPEALKARMTFLAGGAGSFEKEDAYWYTPALPASAVRVRKERATDPQGAAASTVWATYKGKKLQKGIEVNDEREFSVSDGQSFEDLLNRLGLVLKTKKRKQGWYWNYTGITVELALVENLGWFVELEILGNHDDAETVNRSHTRLFDCLRQLGVGEDKIETRYYTELLNLADTKER
jgi:adenylate cyclase class 2